MRTHLRSGDKIRARREFSWEITAMRGPINATQTVWRGAVLTVDRCYVDSFTVRELPNVHFNVDAAPRQFALVVPHRMDEYAASAILNALVAAPLLYIGLVAPLLGMTIIGGLNLLTALISLQAYFRARKAQAQIL